MSKEPLRLGNYQHYKGGLYTAIAIVKHHETQQDMVLYLSHQTGTLTVRPLEKMEIVGGVDADAWSDSIDEGHGAVPRFRYIGPEQINTPMTFTARTVSGLEHTQTCAAPGGGPCTCGARTSEKAR